MHPNNTIRISALLFAATLSVSQAWADLGDGMADVFSLGSHGRRRQRARARAEENEATLKLRAATDLRIADERRLGEVLGQVRNELDFLASLKRYAPDIIRYQEDLLDITKAQKRFWPRLWNVLKGSAESIEDGKFTLATIVAKLSAESPTGAQASCDTWNSTMKYLTTVAAEVNTSVDQLIKVAVTEATKVDVDAFVQIISIHQTLIKAVFYEVDDRIRALENKRASLEQQLAALK